VIFEKNSEPGGRKFQKHLQHGHFSNNAVIRYQGGTGSANFHNTEEHVNKLGREHWAAGSGHSAADPVAKRFRLS
jgi:hypothetical protein